MKATPFTNKNYWTQQALFTGGHKEVMVGLTILMNGPYNLRTMSCWVTSEPTGDVLEATVPFYRGTLDDLPGLLVAIEECLVELGTYVSPF